MDLERLRRFNKALFKREKFISPIRLSTHIMMGFFHGNKIVFVGQNPGQPKVFSDGFVANHLVKESFEEIQENYFVGFPRCRIGQYTIKVLNHLGLMLDDISFTNIVKYSTIKNQRPDNDAQIKQFIKILVRQFKYLKPKKIVAVGNFASYNLNTVGLPHVKIAHPASHRYSLLNVKKDARLIRDGI